MNILFYCNEYPPYPSGGIGSVTKIVAEELAKKGHQIYIIGYYPSSKDLQQKSIINGVTIFRYNRNYRNRFLGLSYFKFLNKIHLVRKIIQKEITFIENKIDEIIQTYKIDILELTDFYDFNYYNASNLKYKKFSIPTILRIHGCVSFLYALKKINNRIAYKNDASHFARCNYISSVSQFSLKYIKENFNTNNFKKTFIIYNPIEDSFLQKNEKEPQNYILFIGKLTESKGCYSLLKAFNILAEKIPGIQLKLIGKGDLKKAQSFITPKYKHQVDFLGYCDRERIKNEIDNCLFACIPTFFENFSMVALEIMGRNKALIYTNTTSGNETIKNEVDGYTVSPQAIEEIAKLMENLYLDKNKREYIANNAYEKVKNNFAVSHIIPLIEKEYNTIIIENSHTNIL